MHRITSYRAHILLYQRKISLESFGHNQVKYVFDFDFVIAIRLAFCDYIELDEYQYRNIRIYSIYLFHLFILSIYTYTVRESL